MVEQEPVFSLPKDEGPPRDIPERPQPFDYGSPRKEILDPSFLYLDGGENPLGPPKQYYELMKRLSQSGERGRAGRTYLGDLAPARDALEQRWGEIPYSTFSLEGSAGIQKELFTLFIEGRNYRVNGIGPHFPIITNFTDIHGYVSDMGYNKVLPYTPIFSSLSDGLDKTIDIAKMMREGDLRKNIIMYVNNPDTPKGDSVNSDVIARLAETVERKGGYLVVDEALGDFLPDDQSAIPLVKEYSRLIVIRSFSKGLGVPGEGIGYAVMSTRTGAEFEKITTPRAIRGAGALTINALSDLDLQLPHYDKSRKIIRTVKAEFTKALAECGVSVLPTDECTPILTVDGIESDYDKRLLQQKVLVVPLDEFKGTHPELAGNRYVRTSLPMEVVNNELVLVRNGVRITEAADRFNAALGKAA